MQRVQGNITTTLKGSMGERINKALAKVEEKKRRRALRRAEVRVFCHCGWSVLGLLGWSQQWVFCQCGWSLTGLLGGRSSGCSVNVGGHLQVSWVVPAMGVLSMWVVSYRSLGWSQPWVFCQCGWSLTCLLGGRSSGCSVNVGGLLQVSWVVTAVGVLSMWVVSYRSLGWSQPWVFCQCGWSLTCLLGGPSHGCSVSVGGLLQVSWVVAAVGVLSMWVVSYRSLGWSQQWVFCQCGWSLTGLLGGPSHGCSVNVGGLLQVSWVVPAMGVLSVWVVSYRSLGWSQQWVFCQCGWSLTGLLGGRSSGCSVNVGGLLQVSWVVAAVGVLSMWVVSYRSLGWSQQWVFCQCGWSLTGLLGGRSNRCSATVSSLSQFMLGNTNSICSIIVGGLLMVFLGGPCSGCPVTVLPWWSVTVPFG